MKKVLLTLLYNRVFSWAFFLLLTALILTLMLLPSDQLSDTTIFDYDKLGHALLFGSWAVLLIQITPGYSRSQLPDKLTYLLVGLLALCFGGVMELLQYLLPIFRSASWADFIADAIGILGGTSIHYYLTRRFSK
ncbi:MAG: VanZ family protein [Bacteroidota bacterium]